MPSSGPAFPLLRIYSKRPRINRHQFRLTTVSKEHMRHFAFSAMLRSSGSGLTATGCPTSRIKGKSEVLAVRKEH
ncbi:MAG TPA: hypothetical protein PL088_19320 [Spirochaetota bacterium]|nr:hypothetical protein [Spirochaetota bacterium]